MLSKGGSVAFERENLPQALALDAHMLTQKKSLEYEFILMVLPESAKRPAHLHRPPPHRSRACPANRLAADAATQTARGYPNHNKHLVYTSTNTNHQTPGPDARGLAIAWCFWLPNVVIPVQQTLPTERPVNKG